MQTLMRSAKKMRSNSLRQYHVARTRTANRDEKDLMLNQIVHADRVKRFDTDVLPDLDTRCTGGPNKKQNDYSINVRKAP
jgi:hypothetical protein